MSINFDDAHKAVKQGIRSADHVLDIAHDRSKRTLGQARHVADDVLDAGDHAARSTGRYVRTAHDWMEEKPHLAALAALAVGIVVGAFLSPRK